MGFTLFKYKKLRKFNKSPYFVKEWIKAQREDKKNLDEQKKAFSRLEEDLPHF